MKNILIFSALLLLPICSLLAQPGKMAEERIKAFRVAYFTDHLRLTPEESQLFWPLFNEYRDKIKAIKKDRQPEKRVEDMTESEADALIQEMLSAEEKELSLKKEYFQKLRKAIPARKIAMIPQTEKEFNKTLLDRMREIRENRN